jgi:hypothetical protein
LSDHDRYKIPTYILKMLKTALNIGISDTSSGLRRGGHTWATRMKTTEATTPLYKPLSPIGTAVGGGGVGPAVLGCRDLCS